METRLRLDADDDEMAQKWERRDEPTEREAVQAIALVLKRIGDSL